jgi:hypothetical protein
MALPTLSNRRYAGNKNIELYVLDGVNLGRQTLTARVSIKDFHDFSLVPNKELQDKEEYANEEVAQREYNPTHAKGLAKYTLGGLVRSVIKRQFHEAGKAVPPFVLAIRDELASGPYAALQPLVVNLRHINPDQLPYRETDIFAVLKVNLTSTTKMFVVDGQHRRGGFAMVLAFLETLIRNGKYPKVKNALFSPDWTGPDGKATDEEIEFWKIVEDVAMNECSVSFEIHIGLHVDEERQLFTDLNNRVKQPSKGLTQRYDLSDAIAEISRDTDVVPFTVASDSDAKSWTSTGLPLNDVIMINRLLVHGKNKQEATSPSAIRLKKDMIIRFWSTVAKIDGILEPQQRGKTVAGQPVMLKALAKLVHDLAYGKPGVKDEKGLETLWTAIKTGQLSFSHDEPLWQALMMDDEERAEKFDDTINDFVYMSAKTSAGLYDGTHVRFGSVHNDIFPRLGDLIRWKLKLNNRGAAQKAREKDAAAAMQEAA